MLCTEFDLDSKIKVVTLVKYYNFYLGHIAMQIIYLLFNFGQTSIMKMAFQMKPTLKSKIDLGHEYKHCSIDHPRCV